MEAVSPLARVGGPDSVCPALTAGRPAGLGRARLASRLQAQLRVAKAVKGHIIIGREPGAWAPQRAAKIK